MVYPHQLIGIFKFFGFMGCIWLSHGKKGEGLNNCGCGEDDDGVIGKKLFEEERMEGRFMRIGLTSVLNLMGNSAVLPSLILVGS